MSGQGWTAQVGAAVGTAAAASAAQLGLGYGLGVVVWQEAASDDVVWTTSLTWAMWIAATSTILGALAGARVGRPAPRRTPAIALAAASSVGALLTVALIAVPARSAVRPDTFMPQTVAAGYAAIGVLVGLVVGTWAAASRAVATNLLATCAWVWTLAVAGVLAGLVGHRGSGAQLGVWHPTGSDRFFGNLDWPGALIVVAGAFLIGLIAARVAVRRGDGELGTTVGGAVGPLVVAFAYLMLAPRLTGVRSTQLSEYLVAPYAVLAGLGGSVLAVALGRRGRTAPSTTFRATAAVRIPTGTVSRKAARSSVKRPPASPPVAQIPESTPARPAKKAAPEKSTPADMEEPTAEKSSGGFMGRFRVGGRAKATEPVDAGKSDAAGKSGTGASNTAGASKTGGRAKGADAPAAEPTPVGGRKAAPKPVDPPRSAPKSADPPIAEPTPVTGPKPQPTPVTPIEPKTPAKIAGEGPGAKAVPAKNAGRPRRATTTAKIDATDATTPMGTATAKPEPADGAEPPPAAPALWVEDDASEPEPGGRRNPFRKLGRRSAD